MANIRKKNKKYCIYNKCCLPENNNVYLIQLVYAVITALILGANRSEFTLTSILLYIMPFLIDLTQNKIENKLYNAVKCLLIFDNILLLIFVISGMFLVEESENFFIIRQTSMFFSGLNISKQNIFVMCFANIIVPLLLYIAVPCQKTIKTIEETEDIVNNKKFSNIGEKEVSI